MTNFAIAPSQPGKRRRFEPAFKAMIIELCQQPESSIASVAQAHQLNPNLVHKWLYRARKKGEITTYPGFVPIPMASVMPTQLDTVPVSATAQPVNIVIDSKVGKINLSLSAEDSVNLLKKLLV